MSRYTPMDPRQTNRNGSQPLQAIAPLFLRGFNNASTAINQLMNDTTWI